MRFLLGLPKRADDAALVLAEIELVRGCISISLLGREEAFNLGLRDEPPTTHMKFIELLARNEG